jgi:5-(hydroxymethyl)furfural/furfural oxidase
VDLVLSTELQPLINAAFPVQFTDRLRLLNRRNTTNAIKTTILAGLLDAAPGLTARVLAGLTSGANNLRGIVADRDALAAHVLKNVAGTFHICGTCRMGAATDRASVVDTAGRVHGVAGLRVADASVMPRIPRGNTNIPTIMLAEKLAASFDNVT